MPHLPTPHPCEPGSSAHAHILRTHLRHHSEFSTPTRSRSKSEPGTVCGGTPASSCSQHCSHKIYGAGCGAGVRLYRHHREGTWGVLRRHRPHDLPAHASWARPWASGGAGKRWKKPTWAERRRCGTGSAPHPRVRPSSTRLGLPCAPTRTGVGPSREMDRPLYPSLF